MIERNDLDRAMTSYFEARSTSHAPDGLLEAALTRVETARQRPGWLIADRWLPVDRSGVARIRVAAVVIATIALIVATTIGIGLLVGSSRRLPPPFGLAKPGLIAYDMGGAIYVVKPDGTGVQQLTSGVADGFETFSPDGTLIAYQAEAQDMSTSVIVMGADGGHPVTVADHLSEVGDIAWSPDSRRVAFGARIMGTSGFHVYVAAVDHPGAVQIGGPTVFGQEPAWSPDGRTIAFKHFRDDSPDPFGAALWLMNADGSDARRLAKASGDLRRDGPLASSGSAGVGFWNTSWSPDGKRLAFLADGVAAHLDVYVINADGTGELDISSSPQDEFWPSWSPDGTRVAFATMNLPAVNQGTAVVVDPNGSNRVWFTGAPINSDTLVWSPDGKRLLGYAKNPDPSQDHNVAIAIFDVAGDGSVVTLPANRFGSASWQRLAP